jgi:glycosyltransferase involved in cell wall biosynthesis
MDKLKKIWYINHYTAPPKFDTHLRTIKFAKYLKQAGYDVTIFSSSFLHNKNIELITDRRKYIRKDYEGVKFVHIKTIKYLTNGILRILSLLQFSIRIFLLRNKFETPDIIIHTAHIPFENLIYFIAKKLKSRYIVEILDLWPESFVAYGIVSRKNPFLPLAYLAEKWLYRKADKIIFSIEGGIDYIIERGWNTENGGPIDIAKISYINNGVDLKDFDKNTELFKTDDPDLNDDSIFKVIYLGSIRLANNLKQLIDAAALLKTNKNIRFLIYGDGSERDKLEKYCNENNINNVIFKQRWIGLEYVPYVLSKSSLNIINHMPSDILRYGGSQGKLFQYLAAGKPICSNQKMGHSLIEKNNLGISESFKTVKDYSDAILSFSQMDEITYQSICERVRNVSTDFDYDVLSEKFIKAIEE